MSSTSNINKRRQYILFLVFFGGLGGLLYGYDLGVISGALIFMHHDLHLTTAQMSFIVGAVLGGGAFATLVSGWIADKLGRKKTILFSGIVFLAGVLCLVFSQNFESALLGRLLQGAGIGVQLIVLPLFLAESAPPNIRGKCVTIYQMFVTLGIVLAYTINLLFEHAQNWRGMFFCVLIPALLLFVLTFYVSESPRWLFLKKQTEKALQSLLRSRDQIDAERDIELMQRLQANSSSEQKSKDSLWQRHYILPFVIALSIACLNQLTGINSVLQFGALILKQSGIGSNLLSMVGTLGIGLVNMVATFFAILIVDKVGRKPLLMIGTLGTAAALCFIGFVSLFGKISLTDGYLTLVGLLLYIVFFAIGPGIVVFLALSELIPTRIRSMGMAICLFANSMVSTILASTFLILVKHINYSGTFLMCAGFTLIYFLIATFVLPETKQKSLEEIEHHFRNKS